MLYYLVLVALLQPREVGGYAPVDGSFHSLWDSSVNSAGTLFFPIPNPYYMSDNTSMIVSPDARMISNVVIGNAPFKNNNHGVAALTAAWGQFIAHDMIMEITILLL